MRAVLLSALLSVASLAACAAEITFVPVAPAARTFHVGALTLTALHDAQIIVANDGETFGLGVSPAEVGKVLRAASAPADRITLSVNVLLVHTGERLLLIDTGLGPQYHGQLLASLKLAGVSPGDVTDVLITHPHPDHIGGLIDSRGQLAFPNAKIRMAAPAWAWMRENGPSGMVRAIASRVQGFRPGSPIAPGVVSVALPGHTPGHVGYEVGSGQARILDIGDLAHSSIVSLARPQWDIEFDNDRAVARRTRLETLAKLARDGEWVYAPHFPFPGVGHIEAAKQGFDWKPGLP